MTCQNHHRDPPEKGGRNDSRLADFQPDDSERLLLTIARHFFRDHAVPDRGDRAVAITLAEISFGYGRGAAIAAAVQDAIQAMRMARRDVFHYHNPDCPGCSGWLTAAEHHYVQTFRAVRTGRLSAASAHAMLLCEGQDYVPFLDAVSQVFRILAGAQWQDHPETRLTD